MVCGQMAQEAAELKLKAGLRTDGPRGRCLKLVQEADELIDKSYGQLKAASLEKVLRAFCFTCECACECSALLTHLSRKAGAEGKVESCRWK